VGGVIRLAGGVSVPGVVKVSLSEKALDFIQGHGGRAAVDLIRMTT
jgi:hypothetical protein